MFETLLVGGDSFAAGRFSTGLSPVRPVRGIVGASMGTELSVAEAFEKWSDDLCGYATVLVGADDANDVVSQAFADVLGSGRWTQVREPRSYLFRATLNAARSQRRGAARRRSREWRTAARAVEGAELLSDPAVIASVNALSVQQRAVIFHTYWEDLTPAATARLLGVSEGTVRRQLARARDKLRKALG